jgi:hypothetical protein
MVDAIRAVFGHAPLYAPDPRKPNEERFAASTRQYGVGGYDGGRRTPRSNVS